MSSMISIYGEMADECREVYMKYACALLELSKNEMNLIRLKQKYNDKEKKVSDQGKNIAKTDKNNLTNEEEKEVSKSDQNNKVNEKSTETGENLAKEVNSVFEEKQSDEVKDKSIDEKEKIEKEITTDEKIIVEEKMDMLIHEETRLYHLKRAQEILNCLKDIYKNKNTEESRLKLAEILMKCGEISIESEQYEMAIQDMTESLEIRRLQLPKNSRIIAETLYKLGITEELRGNSDRGCNLLADAETILYKRIKMLEKSNDDKAKIEMTEIKFVILEIMDKIFNIKERKRVAVSRLLVDKNARANKETTVNSGALSIIQYTSNISHLMPKRPISEEETDGTQNKMSKLEELEVPK